MQEENKQGMSSQEYESQMKKEHGLEENKTQNSQSVEETKIKNEKSDSYIESGSKIIKPDVEKKKTGMAFVAYIFFLIPLLTEAKDDEFVKYHVKQSLALLLAWIVVSVFSMVPLIGWVFGPILAIILVVFWFLGVINALSGEKKRLPLIGEYAEKINFHL